MRDATKEERESIHKYIKSISEPMIPLSVIDDIKAEIQQMNYLTIEDGSDGYDIYVDRYDVLKVIDTIVKEHTS